MISEEALTAAYLRHWKTVWHICYPYFLNHADTEDAVQDTFVRLANVQKTFRDAEHEKAWLIVTARNVCRDELRRARRKNVPLEALAETEPSAAVEPEHDETQTALYHLPEKFRTALYLFYYEGYSTAEIARLMKRPEATVRSDLHRGRELLKKELGGERT